MRKEKNYENGMMEELYRYRVGKYVKVDDDWSPNFPNNEVYVSHVIFWFGGKGRVIQSVYGMDDASVERRFTSKNPDELIKQWKIWKEFYDKIPMITNKKWYLKRGFVDG